MARQARLVIEASSQAGVALAGGFGSPRLRQDPGGLVFYSPAMDAPGPTNRAGLHQPHEAIRRGNVCLGQGLSLRAGYGLQPAGAAPPRIAPQAAYGGVFAHPSDLYSQRDQA